MADLITIRMQLIGARAVASEAKVASGAVASTGTAAAATGAQAARATKGTSAFSSGLRTLGRYAKYGAAAGLAAVGYELYRSVGAYRDAAKVAKQTNAVIKSTGGVANVTADQVEKLANTLSLKTRIDDEEIQSASNMLLTFTKIRNEVGKGNDVFDHATEAVLDLAAGTKTDLLSATKQLGKALNDPIAGLTALSRGGTQFTEQQKEQIATLIESGHQLQAQKLILREIDEQYKGSARAQHDVWDGLAVTWENLEEALGKLLAPALKDAARWLTKFIRQAQAGRGAGGKFVHTLEDIWGAAKSVVGAIKDVVNWIGNAGRKINDTLHPLEAMKLSWDTLSGALRKVKPGFDAIAGALKATWSVFKSIGEAIGFVIGKLIELGETFSQLPGPLGDLLGTNDPILGEVTGGGTVGTGTGFGSTPNPNPGFQISDEPKDPKRRRRAPAPTAISGLALGGAGRLSLTVPVYLRDRQIAEATAEVGEDEWARH